MKFFYVLCIALLSLLWHEQVFAQNNAILVRDTELKKQPYLDAISLASMKENEKINLIARKASWMEVRYGNQQGWVKMISLRFVTSSVDSKKDNSPGTSNNTNSTLRSLYNLGTTGKSGSTVTTAARGLDENKFSNPSPNLAALEIIQRYTSEKVSAEKFASEIKLKEQQLAYLKSKGEK